MRSDSKSDKKIKNKKKIRWNNEKEGDPKRTSLGIDILPETKEESKTYYCCFSDYW